MSANVQTLAKISWSTCMRIESRVSQYAACWRCRLAPITKPSPGRNFVIQSPSVELALRDEASTSAGPVVAQSVATNSSDMASKRAFEPRGGRMIFCVWPVAVRSPDGLPCKCACQRFRPHCGCRQRLFSNHLTNGFATLHALPYTPVMDSKVRQLRKKICKCQQ